MPHKPSQLKSAGDAVRHPIVAGKEVVHYLCPTMKNLAGRKPAPRDAPYRP